MLGTSVRPRCSPACPLTTPMSSRIALAARRSLGCHGYLHACRDCSPIVAPPCAAGNSMMIDAVAHRGIGLSELITYAEVSAHPAACKQHTDREMHGGLRAKHLH